MIRCHAKELKEKRMWTIYTAHYHLSSNTYFFFSFSSTFHPTFWVSKVLHWTACFHPMCCGLRGLTHHDHLAEGWPTNPSKPWGDHWQHWLHQLLKDFQPFSDAQWKLHLHSPEWGGRRGAPKPANCERWVRCRTHHSYAACLGCLLEMLWK